MAANYNNQAYLEKMPLFFLNRRIFFLDGVILKGETNHSSWEFIKVVG